MLVTNTIGTNVYRDGAAKLDQHHADDQQR